MSEERGGFSDVFVHGGDRPFDSPILQWRSACSLGFDSDVGCVSVDYFVGAFENEFIGVGSVDESGAHA